MNFKEELTCLIGKIGYEILDDIVSPMAGIGGAFADLYIATINDHTFDDDIDDKILFAIEKKYSVSMGMFSGGDPLISIIVYILENGEYKNEL